MQDKEQQHQAAFVSKDPSDFDAHQAHWEKMLANPEILNRTVVVDGEVIGSIGRWMMDGVAQITYWFGKEFTGKSYATNALKMFLELDQTRPIEGRAAFDNFASMRVLEKCGFVKTGTDLYFSNARNAEIEEVIFELR